MAQEVQSPLPGFENLKLTTDEPPLADETAAAGALGLKDKSRGPETVEDTSDKETKTALEKLRTVYREYGFLPASQKELTEVWEIRKYRDRPSPVASYLNRILLHQKKPESNSEEPEKALITKVTQWGKWRESNRGDLAALGYMLDLMKDETSGQKLTKSDGYDGSFERGADIAVLTNALAREIEEGDAAWPYREAAREQDVSSLFGQKLKQVVWQAEISAINREAFWKNAILGAEFHMLVKGLVEKLKQDF